MEFSLIGDAFNWLVGSGETSGDLAPRQMMTRALICYAFALGLVRIGDKRFLGKSTAFDVILGVVLGSVISRAITGNSAFVATLAAGAMLMALHWLLAFTTFHSDRFGDLAKGTARLLVKNGDIQRDVVSKSHVSTKDLEQAQREQGIEPNIESIAQAHIERNGDITIIEKAGEPRILEVDVRDGVQTIRIQLG